MMRASKPSGQLTSAVVNPVSEAQIDPVRINVILILNKHKRPLAVGAGPALSATPLSPILSSGVQVALFLEKIKLRAA